MQLVGALRRFTSALRSPRRHAMQLVGTISCIAAHGAVGDAAREAVSNPLIQWLRDRRSPTASVQLATRASKPPRKSQTASLRETARSGLENVLSAFRNTHLLSACQDNRQ